MKDDVEDVADFFIMPSIVFPRLSDESAYEISEYLQSIAQAFDAYYFSQIRRYLKEQENLVDLVKEDEYPF